MMQSGTHNYDRDPRLPRMRTNHDRKVLQGEVPWVMGGNPTPDEVAAQMAAERRDAVPTLAEIKAAMPMVAVEQPDGEGGIAPAKLPDFGWAADGDRDSTQAAELAELVRQMDIMCEHVMTAHIPGAALKLAGQWQAIRKITQSNQTGEAA